MALNLGGTIAELQSKMTHDEVVVWFKYREKYGPLNPVRMYDQSGALVATQINNSNGGKAKPIDFMPYAPKQEDDREVAQDEFFNLLSAGAKIGR